MAERVLVGMSGGVDSTAAALLLRERGYEVIGLTLVLLPQGKTGRSYSAAAAARAARELGIPHEVVPAYEAFREKVIEPTLAAYRAGLTPNPCVICNRVIKFGLLLREADRRGIPYIATGHYARIGNRDGMRLLLRGRDREKDQSYFLYSLTQKELGRALLPLGELAKEEVRRLVRNLIGTRMPPESQDLCFAPEGVGKLLSGLPPGPIYDLWGRRLGTHQGLPHYTVGQRRGLGLTSEKPLYVVALDPGRNAVIVGPEEALYSPGMVVGKLSWIAGTPPDSVFDCEVQIRYRAPAVPARVTIARDQAEVVFARPVRAVTPGQAAVFYRGDELLGGGTISSPLFEVGETGAALAVEEGLGPG